MRYAAAAHRSGRLRRARAGGDALAGVARRRRFELIVNRRASPGSADSCPAGRARGLRVLGHGGARHGGAGATPKTAEATPAATEAEIKDDDGDGIEDPVTVKGAVGDTLELNGSGLGNKDPSDHTRPRSASR